MHSPGGQTRSCIASWGMWYGKKYHIIHITSELDPILAIVSYFQPHYFRLEPRTVTFFLFFNNFSILNLVQKFFFNTWKTEVHGERGCWSNCLPEMIMWWYNANNITFFFIFICDFHGLLPYGHTHGECVAERANVKNDIQCPSPLRKHSRWRGSRWQNRFTVNMYYSSRA